MSISFQASADGTYGSILVGGVEKFRVDNAGNVTATKFTGTVVGDASQVTGIFGQGQTLQDVTASRTSGTTYTNTTGKLIFVIAKASLAAGASVSLTVDGVERSRFGNSGSGTSTFSVSSFVPNGSTYVITGSSLSVYEYR